MRRAAVLTISDSSFAGTRQDLSGPALRDALERSGWEVAITEVLPDDRAAITARLTQLADGERIALVITTGGTGVAPRDVTPEATRDVIEKEIPGLGEVMRTEGQKFTPLAALSRSMGGTRGRTLIVNVPGSPKGAVQSWNAIVNLVPHIVDLIHGITEHHTGKRERNT